MEKIVSCLPVIHTVLYTEWRRFCEVHVNLGIYFLALLHFERANKLFLASGMWAKVIYVTFALKLIIFCWCEFVFCFSFYRSSLDFRIFFFFFSFFSIQIQRIHEMDTIGWKEFLSYLVRESWSPNSNTFNGLLREHFSCVKCL